MADAVQKLCQVALPLARSLEFLQEDVESMSKEYRQVGACRPHMSMKKTSRATHDNTTPAHEPCMIVTSPLATSTASIHLQRGAAP